MENSPGSIPSTDSSSKSEQSGHLPGTPKPPFEPPRRRSSLFFTKVLQHTHSPKTPGGSSSKSSGIPQPEGRHPKSNIGRKRLASPLTRSIVMPGHVAQMQRLFQSAKASLRLDVRYAASPNGTIDSRLPATPEDGSATGTDDLVPAEKQDSETASKEWRYSRAPRLLAEFDVDVREPFPDTSPQLPQLHSVDADRSKVLDAEPPSSGFASPLNSSVCHREPDEVVLHSSPQHLAFGDDASERDDSSDSSAAALEGPFTDLRVSGDEIMDNDLADESPIVTHLKRRSKDMVVDGQPGPAVQGMITLSAPAKAAADSAKVKRGMLSSLFPRPPTRRGSDRQTSSSGSQRSSNEAALTPCPDPLLHERGPVVLCPDPGLHYGNCTPNSFGYNTITPSPHLPSHYSHQHGLRPGNSQSTLPFNRATATGSPMPVLKLKSPPRSPAQMRHHPHDAWYGAPQNSQRQYQRHQRDPLNREYPSTTEHFRPGWYYAKENAGRLGPPGPAMYSFSTAAAKVVGHDPAPDSRIRDSYRTDTLTPLARPLTRFRKNGIVAIASARSVGKFYGPPTHGPRPPGRSFYPRPTHLPDSQRFRSSPPRSLADSFQRPQLRKRSREVETPTTDVLEDEAEKERAIDSKLRLEEGDEVIEVDDETRAAVRMSLYGAIPRESSSEVERGIRELSPNVVAWRKDTRPPGSRKKRRPSYWDGDLEEVVRSPAARHVVSSPVKKDDVRSQQAEVEFHDDSLTAGVVMEDEPNDLSTVPEGTALQDDTLMES